MALEFTPEFVTEQGLTAEQVSAISLNANTWHDEQVVDLKGTYDGKANKDAEGILNGAVGKITDLTTVARNEGEKVADYMSRAWGQFSSTEKAALETAKNSYEAKLKDFKGDEATASELNELRTKFDDLQAKTADYDDVSEFKGKYETLSIEHLSMKEKVVFGNVKPSFPDTVDEYRGAAMWKEFMEGVKKSYTVELVDGESIAIDKDNVHRVVKLKDLLAKDETISKLLEGRKQSGTGGKEIPKIKVEGVPFEIPQGADGKTVQGLIQEHLTAKGLQKMSTEYSTEFGILYQKIRGQQTA